MSQDGPSAPGIPAAGATPAPPPGAVNGPALLAALARLREGVIVADADGRITFVNAAARLLHGTAPLDVAPDGYADAYHLLTVDGRPYPSSELPLARAVGHGETVVDARWRIRRPDGTEVLAVGSAWPVVGPDGRRAGAVLTVRDDTDRAVADEATRERDALAGQLREVFAQSPVSTILYDGAGRPLAVNAAFERLWGVRLSDLPVDYSVLDDPQLAAAGVLPLLRRAFGLDGARTAEGDGEPVAIPPLRYDVTETAGRGRTTWTRAHAYPVRDATGAVARVVLAHEDVTAQHEAVAALEARTAEAEATRAQMEAVLEAMADRYFALDADFRVVAMNGAMERAVGMARAEMVGRSFWSVFPGAVGTEFERQYRRVAAERVEAHFSARYGDGRLNLVADVDAYPAPGGGLAVFWRDITQRVDAEAALRTSEAKYRALFASMDQGFCIVEVLLDDAGGAARPVDYRFVEANPAFERQTGLAGPLGRAAREAVPGLERHWIETYGRVALTGEPARFRNGSEAMGRWFDVYAFRVGAPEERRVAILFTDVSSAVAAERERERLLAAEGAARAAAERSAARTAQLLAVTAALAGARTVDDVAAVLVAEGGRAAGASTGALMLRVSSGEAAVVRHAGLAPEVVSEYGRFPVDTPGPAAEALRTGVPVFVESRDGPAGLFVRFPELPELWARTGTHALASVPLAVAGAVVGAMTFTFDAPRALDADDRAFFLALGRQAAQAVERARLFEAEREARTEAERQRGAAEAARLASEAARVASEEARAAAEAANQAKAQFLANMSHELRTPLNAIGGYVQLLDMGIHGPVTAAQREALARVARAQGHLLGLITDVLSYARLESGRVEYDVRPTRASAVLAAVLPLVEPQLRAKGLSLGVRLPEAADDPAGLVCADGEKLGQVLLNLLSNAVKFTDPGGRVDVVLDGGPEGAALLRVRDTGRGIAADKLEAAFAPFVQVGKRYAGEAPGTGLGLAISRDLARGMGGDLTVESTPGVGSTFTISLPRPRPA